MFPVKERSWLSFPFSGSILSKFTSILLVIFFISAIVIAILSARSSKTITETDITKTEFSDYKARTTIVDPNKEKREFKKLIN